ncbi:MAG: Hemolysin secretion protein [Rhodospirillales bacterium]|nr:Hemolysin secretion protein [Rhodospirillales bacterium]
MSERKRTHSSIVFLSAALAAGALALADCGPADAPAPKPPTVAVAKPIRKTVTDWDEFTGRFEATAQVDIRARVSGYLETVAFKDGAIVQKGDLLFVIDPRPYEAALKRSQAALASAQARVTQSGRDLIRSQELLRAGNVAATVNDQRVASARQAEADVAGALAAIQTDALNLEFTNVVAPISGRISRKYVNEGNLVSGGDGATVLTTIVSLDPIHFYFDADELSYLKYTRLSLAGLRPSSRDVPNPVMIATSDETEFTHEGRMDFVDNSLDRDTGTMRGRALVPNPKYLFTPGQFGRLRLLGSAPYEALLIPDEAVGTDQSRKVAYVVGGDNVVAAREIKIGRLFDGLRAVTDGLKPDDTVVVSGLQRLRIGSPVTPEMKPINSGTKTGETTAGAGAKQ